MNVEMCPLIKTGILLIGMGLGLWIGRRWGNFGAIVGGIIGIAISSLIAKSIIC